MNSTKLVWSARAVVIAGVVVCGIHDVLKLVSTWYLKARGGREEARRPGDFFFLRLPLCLSRWLLGENSDGGEGRQVRNGRVKAPVTEVLFFPDDGIPCQEFHHSRAGCPRGIGCPFLHEETAYFRLSRLLRGARSTIDVCVFCLTSPELVSLLIHASRAVAVRVITDSEQLRAPGSQIGALRKEGVVVRHDNTSYLMHHKFAIIDGEKLVNGSFNWTRTAVTGNHENLVISDDARLVAAFQKEFDSLWAAFDPKGQKGFVEKPVRETWVTADHIR